PPFVGGREIAPADLLLGAARHLRAESTGNELTAEADAEHRESGGDGLADQLDLGREMGMAFRLVDVHRPAEHDETAVACEARARVGIAAEVHVADAEAVAAKERIEGAEDLVRHVLEDEQTAHEHAS